MKNKSSKKGAFSFIELALVITIIGALAGGIIGGQKLVEMAALNGARSTTQTSPVSVIDGLALWLDTTSKKSFNVTQSQSGKAVSIWYDINPKVNNPMNFSQSSVPDQPVYTSKALGRLPALVFPAGVMTSVDNIKVDRIASETGEITIFAVGKKDSGSGGASFFWLNIGSLSNRIGLEFGANLPATIYWNYGVCCTSSGRTSASFTPYVNKMVIVTGVRKIGTAELRINGAQKSIVSSTIAQLPASGQAQAIIGSGDNSGQRLTGAVAELIIFNRGLGASEVADVEAYLSQKWKIKLE